MPSGHAAGREIVSAILTGIEREVFQSVEPPVLRPVCPPAAAFCRHVAGYTRALAAKPKKSSPKLTEPGARDQYPHFFHAIACCIGHLYEAPSVVDDANADADDAYDDALAEVAAELDDGDFLIDGVVDDDPFGAGDDGEWSDC